MRSHLLFNQKISTKKNFRVSHSCFIKCGVKIEMSVVKYSTQLLVIHPHNLFLFSEKHFSTYQDRFGTKESSVTRFMKSLTFVWKNQHFV